MIGSAPDKSDSIDMGATHVLYTMDIIRLKNLEFPSERVMISEDIVFNLSYYQFAKAVCFIDACDYCYFANQGSLTMRYRENRFKLVKDLYFAEIEMLKRMKLYEISRIRLLRTFFYNIKVCIIQEKRRLSKNSYTKQIGRIGAICKDSDVMDAIKQYPINKLKMPQRIFLEIIKTNRRFALWVLIEMNILS
jgi:hypothetical protein